MKRDHLSLSSIGSLLSVLALVVPLLLAGLPTRAGAVETAKFDFVKRITVSVGAQREFYQQDGQTLGKDDQAQWTAGLFGSFRLGKVASIVASETRGLEKKDWRTTLGVRATIWRGAKTPLDEPPPTTTP